MVLVDPLKVYGLANRSQKTTTVAGRTRESSIRSCAAIRLVPGKVPRNRNALGELRDTGDGVIRSYKIRPTPERWLSGRKQRFAKPSYWTKTGTEGSNPSLSASNQASTDRRG